MGTKQPKKLTKKQAAKKARSEKRKQLAAWSKLVRAAGACEVCGRTEYIDSHHIIPKERFPQFQYEPMNGVALCKSHHKFGSYSAHRHPIWFAVWLQSNRPDKYAWVRERLGCL